MHLKKIAQIGFPLFAMSTVAEAAPSIDFVIGEGVATTFRSVECSARKGQEDRWGATVQGQLVAGAVEVPLDGLLAGGDGKYQVKCAAIDAEAGDRYEAQFEAVRFREGEPGSDAPKYDGNRLGYGVKIPLSETLGACYGVKFELVLDPKCVSEYYGKKKYFLNSTSGAENVRFGYNTEYATNVGVFLNKNPRYSAR